MARPRKNEAKAEEGAAAERGSGVQSITRALALLEELAASDEGLTLTDLARRVRLPPSSAHRLLTTLQHARFVRFEPASMAWQVGVGAFLVGSAFTRTRDLVSLALPHMRRLMSETGETTNLFVLDREEVICMAQVQSQQMVRAISRPGSGVELHRSAAGKAILAYMDPQEMQALITRRGLRRYTERTITTPDALEPELVRIRAEGVSIDNEEFSLGLRCVAAPIFTEAGAVQAAISIAGPSARITPARLPAVSALVRLCGERVTAEMGGSAASARLG